MKSEPPTVDGFFLEEQPLLKQPVAAEAAPVSRRWKEHFCNIFGDCSAHDWKWCCLTQWAPCMVFGINMNRALKLRMLLQAVLYFLLFSGVARIADNVAEKECPMWSANPDYVALYGEPAFPPPHGFHNHHHHHDGEHHHHHHHDKEAKEPQMGGDMKPAFPAAPAVEFEIEIEFEKKPVASVDPIVEEVPMVAVDPVEEPMATRINHMTQKLKDSKMNVRQQVEQAKAQHGSALFDKLSKTMFEGKLAKQWWEHVKSKHAERRGLEEMTATGAPHVHPYVMNKKCARINCGVSVAVAIGSLFFVVYAATRRTQMREKFGIEGNKFLDCIAWLMCPFCALAQESRTLSHHQVEDGEWPEEAPVVQYAQVPTIVIMQA
jgi:Cys-rich protein (TIGR01571 family)